MAFSYGSVVIFNAQSELLSQALLNMCREFTKQTVNEEYVEGGCVFGASSDTLTRQW